jgi:hypothetical protein
MYRRNLMPARRAVRWGAWRATGTAGCAVARWTAGTHGGVFTFSHLGNQLMSLFRFAFRADGVRLFTEAQRNHFKLFFAFIAFIFVYRHNVIFLTFYFNLEMKTENVNTCKVIRACNCQPAIVHWHSKSFFLYCNTWKTYFLHKLFALLKGNHEGKR